MNNSKSKILYTVFYLAVTWLFIVLFLWVFISSLTIKTFIFSLTFLFILFLPILFIWQFKIKIYYFLIIIFWLIFSIYNSFLPNQSKYNNYEMICFDCSKYNFNLLNNISEKEFLNAWFKLWWLLKMSYKELNSFKTILLKYEEIDIKLPTLIWNAILNKKERKYISYFPPNYKKDTAIFVIHWNAWGFLFYQKFFKQFADKYNMSLITPAFWWWNWDEKWWTELIFDTYNDLLKKWQISKDTKIILIWLSNWWKWLSRAIYFDDKNIFSKIVYISAIIENEVIWTQQFINNSKNKDFFVIHWKKDDRAFFKRFLESSKYMPNLDTLIFENWDHFILLNEEKESIKFLEKIIEK